nr:hypothetical protein [Pseudopedobacter sp.]
MKLAITQTSNHPHYLKIGYCFSAVCLFQLLLVHFELKTLYASELYELSDGGETGIFNGFTAVMKWSFVLFPFYLFLKFVIICLIIESGFSYHGLKSKVSFSTLFLGVIIAYPLLLAPQCFKLIYFHWMVPTDYLRSHYAHFAPLSMVAFFTDRLLEQGTWYLLQSVNLFDLGYPFVIALVIKKMAPQTGDHTAAIVYAYYLAYFCWMLFTYLLQQSI